jgi:hypothetical protein
MASDKLRQQIIQDLDQKIEAETRIARNLHIDGNHYKAGLTEQLIKVLRHTRDVFLWKEEETNF